MTECDGRNMHTFIIMQTIIMQTHHSQHCFYCYTSNNFLLNGGGNVLILLHTLHRSLSGDDRLPCSYDVTIVISSRLVVVTRIELLEE